MYTINRGRLCKVWISHHTQDPEFFKARKMSRSLLLLTFLKLILAVMFIVLFSSGMNKNSFQSLNLFVQ